MTNVRKHSKSIKKELAKSVFNILITNNPRLEHFIEVFSHEPSNIAQRPLGRLIGFFKVNDSGESNAYLVNLLTSVLKKEYYANIQRDPMSSLEATLHKVNVNLAEWAKQRSIDWIGKLEGAVCALDESNIHFSVTGPGRVFLVRENKMLDISEGLASEEANAHPLKTFTDISSGKLQNSDKVLISSQELFDLFSEAEIERKACAFSKTDFRQFIHTALVNEYELATTILIDVDEYEVKKESVPKATPTSSMNTSTKTEPSIAPKTVGNVFDAKTFEEKKKPSQKLCVKIESEPTHVPENLSEQIEQIGSPGNEYIDKKTGPIYIHQRQRNSSEFGGKYRERLLVLREYSLNLWENMVEYSQIRGRRAGKYLSEQISVLSTRALKSLKDETKNTPQETVSNTTTETPNYDEHPTKDHPLNSSGEIIEQRPSHSIHPLHHSRHKENQFRAQQKSPASQNTKNQPSITKDNAESKEKTHLSTHHPQRRILSRSDVAEFSHEPSQPEELTFPNNQQNRPYAQTIKQKGMEFTQHTWQFLQKTTLWLIKQGTQLTKLLVSFTKKFIAWANVKITEWKQKRKAQKNNEEIDTKGTIDAQNAQNTQNKSQKMDRTQQHASLLSDTSKRTQKIPIRTTRQQKVSSSSFLPNFTRMKKLFSSLDTRGKTYVIAVLLLIIFVPLVFLNRSNDSNTKKTEQSEQEQTDSPSITELTAPTKQEDTTTLNNKEAIDSNTNEPQERLNQQNTLTKLDSSTIFTTDSPPQNVYAGEDTVLVIDDGGVTVLDENGDSSRHTLPEEYGIILQSTYMDALNLLFLTTTSLELVSFSPISTTFEKNSITLPESTNISNITAIQDYTTYLYLFDSNNKTIYRYARVEGGFDSRKNWLSSGETLTTFTDWAIDGDIYVISDGTLNKYTSGQKESFPQLNPTVPPTLKNSNTSPTLILTNADRDNISVISKDIDHLGVLDKNGTYTKQFELDVASDAIDIAVSPNNPSSLLVLLKNGELHSITIP